MKSVKQVAAGRVRCLVPTTIFGLIIVMLSYVLVLRGESVNTYMLPCIFGGVWLFFHVLILAYERIELKSWARFTGRDYV